MSKGLSGEVQGEQTCLPCRQREEHEGSGMGARVEECRVECKGEVSQARSRTVGYRGVWSLPP